MHGRHFPTNRRIRPALGVVVTMSAIALLLGPWRSAWPVERAAADPPGSPPGQSRQPAPQETPPEPSPEPEPEPSPEPSPEPEPQPTPEPAPGSPAKPPAQPGSGGGEGGGGGGVSSPKASTPRGLKGRAGDARKTGPEGCLAVWSQLAGSRPDLGPPNSTARLVGILAPLEGTGISLGEALRRVAGPFPVAGEATWSNDWHAIRCNPTPHPHMGIDIFARAGTPLVAVADGRLTQKGEGAVSGFHVEITDADGVQYFYAHLSSFGPELELGQTVATGDVLGYVGTTGNARGTSPHVHFEVQPQGVAVPPKPFVDRWLAIAERRAVRWGSSARGTVVEAPRARPTEQGTRATTPPVAPEPFSRHDPALERSWGHWGTPPRASSAARSNAVGLAIPGSLAFIAVLALAWGRRRDLRLLAERTHAVQAWGLHTGATSAGTAPAAPSERPRAASLAAAGAVLLTSWLLGLYLFRKSSSS